MTYTLEPLTAPADRDGPAELRRARKVGFCLYDTARYRDRSDAPARARYPRVGCGTERSTTLRMGLSVGWGDMYFWSLRGQYVDLTGLPAGRYRLTGVANPQNALFESREDNNTAFVDLVLRRGPGGPSLRILDRPAASPTVHEH